MIEAQNLPFSHLGHNLGEPLIFFLCGVSASDFLIKLPELLHAEPELINLLHGRILINIICSSIHVHRNYFFEQAQQCIILVYISSYIGF